MPDLAGGSSPAVTMAVYAALGYDIVAATNSSPQTTEINAGARGPTLKKWVKIGEAQLVGFAVLGVMLETNEGRPWWPPLVGAGLAGVLLWMQYSHALRAGMQSSAPPTESYG